MSTQRDELAQVVANTRIKIWGVNEDELCEYDYDLADAILAADTLKPRVIETVEELDALPVGSVVIDADEYVGRKERDTAAPNWAVTLHKFSKDARAFSFPATVLHVPGVAQ